MSAAQDGGGNVNGLVATNAISSAFADNAWVYDSTQPLNDVVTRDWIGQLASGQHIIISDDLSGATRIIQYCVTTAGVAGSWATIYSGSATDRSTWAVAQISTTAIYLIGISAASTLAFNSFNGTSWSTLSAPSWPTGGVKTNGITLVTDGTDVWAVAILNDSANTIAYAKYNVGGASWGAWTNLVTSTQVRNHLSPAQKVGNSLVAFLYTQTNGSNFDVTVDSFSTASASAPPKKQTQIYSPRRRARLRRLGNSRAIVLLKAPRGVSQIDPTTLAGAATMSASLTSGIALAASLTGHGDLSPSLLTGTSVTAALQGSATLSASLSTAIPLDTLFHGTGTLAADLTTGISLSSSLLGAATFTASLTTGATVARPSIIQVSGYRRSQRRERNRRQTILQLVAYQPGPASGALSASLLGTATLTASLSTGIRLQASLTGAATMTAALTTQVQLATALTGAGTLAAALSTQIPLATNLTGAATLLANLLAGSSLTASLLGIGTLAADLNAGAATMAASLIGSATLSGDLTTGQGFGVNLIARALLNASLTTSIPLGALLSVSATLAATLTALPGSQLLKGKLRVVPAWLATLSVTPQPR
jgi:hypothetical protein